MDYNMRLEWLEDILAVLESGSFIRAAEQRFLTQPAFSRRIKTIENYVGVELFDRSKKPIQLKNSVIDQQRNIRELVTGLRDLLYELKRQDRETHNQIVIASQHAITTSVAPSLIKKLSDSRDISFRLRSANRDECYALLMTKQADLILIYQTENEQLPSQAGFLEQCELRQDLLIPVYATAELQKLEVDYAKGEIPVVVYPADVFLGKVVNQEIFPHMWSTTSIRKKAETALTLAALQLALAGVGVAWLPHSLASPELANGVLTELSDMLPSCKLSIVAIRLEDPKSPVKDFVWQVVYSTTDTHCKKEQL
jgi:DNA-binding transcriptional LysR family regulator